MNFVTWGHFEAMEEMFRGKIKGNLHIEEFIVLKTEGISTWQDYKGNFFILFFYRSEFSNVSVIASITYIKKSFRLHPNNLICS